MSFIAKKKKYKFAVKLTLEGLSSVPYINGLLYAKVRLIDGGSFVATSAREEVTDHCVKWNSRFDFECKMSANASNGVLNSCLLRVSVRKVGRSTRLATRALHPSIPSHSPPSSLPLSSCPAACDVVLVVRCFTHSHTPVHVHHVPCTSFPAHTHSR